MPIIFSPDGSENPRRDCNEQRENGQPEIANCSLLFIILKHLYKIGIITLLT